MFLIRNFAALERVARDGSRDVTRVIDFNGKYPVVGDLVFLVNTKGTPWRIVTHLRGEKVIGMCATVAVHKDRILATIEPHASANPIANVRAIIYDNNYTLSR